MKSNAQVWNPEQYARDARYVAELALPSITLLAPQPEEYIVDLGCGDGFLAQHIASTGAKVFGIDASPEQVDATRSRGLAACVMDGQNLAFASAFNAVFSNAALHWMQQSDAVIAGVWRTLKPGGRFVAEFGGHGSVATIINAIYTALARRGLNADIANPWYYPTEESYHDKLEAYGFKVTYMTYFERPTKLPITMAQWLNTFAQSFLSLLGESSRHDFVQEVCETLKPQLFDEQHNQWTADYVRIRFSAQKE